MFFFQYPRHCFLWIWNFTWAKIIFVALPRSIYCFVQADDTWFEQKLWILQNYSSMETNVIFSRIITQTNVSVFISSCANYFHWFTHCANVFRTSWIWPSENVWNVQISRPTYQMVLEFFIGCLSPIVLSDYCLLCGGFLANNMLNGCADVSWILQNVVAKNLWQICTSPRENCFWLDLYHLLCVMFLASGCAVPSLSCLLEPSYCAVSFCGWFMCQVILW